MKHLKAFSSTLALAVISSASAQWNLVWQDEFTAATINSANWTHEVNAIGGGNNELQFYTARPQNSFIDNGMLVIRAIKESYTAFDPAQGSSQTRQYTSARLNSRLKADFRYGRIEVRAQVPGGTGSWPAAWMLPTDYVYGGWARSGEIDITEFNGDFTSRTYGTIHYGDTWPNNAYSGTNITDDENLTQGLHEYAIEWEDGVIRWYFDGVLFLTQTEWYSTGNNYPAPFDQDFHIILNLAVGGNFVTNPPANANYFPLDYKIDYVRVYERVSPAAQMAQGGTPVNIPGRVQAENFDVGGQGITYVDVEQLNQGTQYRPSDFVDIEATTDAGGGYNVGWVEPNEWMEYTVNAQQSGRYRIDARVASQPAGGTLRVFMNPDGANTQVGPVSFPATGGWQTWTTIPIGEVVLPLGQHIMRAQMNADEFNLNWFEFTYLGIPAELSVFSAD